MTDHDYWWEGRRDNELTPDYLGRVLDEVGLEEMAKKARLGHYDDYMCPPEFNDGLNMLHLRDDLMDAASSPKLSGGPAARKRVRAIADSIMDGEFDGTTAESDRWAASKEGQETLDMLPQSMRRLFDVQRKQGS